MTKSVLLTLAVVLVSLAAPQRSTADSPGNPLPIRDWANDAIVEARDPEPEGKGTAGDPLEGLYRDQFGDRRERDDRRPPEGEDGKSPILDGDRRPNASGKDEFNEHVGQVPRGAAGGFQGTRGGAGVYETYRGAAGGNDGVPGAAGENAGRHGAAGYGGEDE